MKKKSFTTLSLRTAIMLFVMLLTATQTAWATDITVTYKIAVSFTTKYHAEITNVETGQSVCTWSVALGITLWPADADHRTSDYGITFTPDQDLTRTNENEKGKTASTTAFKTGKNTTRFTVAVANNSNYYLKSVTFKEDDTEKASLEVAPNEKSGVVTVQPRKFFNYITVELTTDRLYSVNPGNGLSVTSDPARIYNNAKLYAAGSTVTVAPTNASCIVEGVNGVASYDIASDKRSFSFTMPASNASPSATLAEVHTISVPDGMPNGVSVSDPYITIGGTDYYLKGNTYTFTAPDNNIIRYFDATDEATLEADYSVAPDMKSASVTIGSDNVIVSVIIAALSGTCGDNATWRMSDENNDGKYETLHIEGTGAMNNYSILALAPWADDFNHYMTTVNIANGITYIGNSSFRGSVHLTEVTLPSSVSGIGEKAFYACSELTRVNILKSDGMVELYNPDVFGFSPAFTTIVVPTPELAVQYKADKVWKNLADKLRVPFGNYLFKATDEGGTAAYAITSETDLRNLSAVVYGTTKISKGKVFATYCAPISFG